MVFSQCMFGLFRVLREQEIIMKSAQRNRWFAVIVLLLVVGMGLGFGLAQTASPPETPVQNPAFVYVINGRGVCMTDVGVRYLVSPSLIIPSGPGRDGIPSIDHPQYVSLDEADEWIADDELVLGFRRVFSD